MTMRCKDALKIMHEVLDGEATESLIAEFQAHTSECEACARAYERLLHWDRMLRSADADEPDDAYFHAMANRISASVRAEEPQPAPIFRLSWSFASALAAACLVLGLGIGHFAFPRTIAETRTVVERVPGPVREVEKVVTKEVRVPVEVPVEVVRWRTRTVTKVKEVAAEPRRADVTYVARGATPSPPVPPATVEAPAETPTLVAAPTLPQPTTYRAHYASLFTGTGRAYEDRGLTHDEFTALARRLSEDMGKLDEALNAPRLASTLVSDLETADAEIERAITSASPEAHPQ